MDNNLVEILAVNNPFLSPYINDDNIGSEFEMSGFTIGDIVCTSELYNELISRFWSYENAKKFYEFARTLIVKGEYSNYGESESIPYLNFTVYLEETVNDGGVYKPYIERWVENKKYYIGDMVYYSIDGTDEGMKCYVLTDGGDDTYDIIEISKETYDANHDNNSNYFIEDGKYYLKLLYYKGYYDEVTQLTYFDTYENGQIVFEHWLETTAVETEYEIPSTTSGVTSSLLNNVKRNRTDMDISGNTLPFILHYNVESDKRVLDKTTTELPYMCGFNSIRYGSNGLCSDVLVEIDFYNGNEFVSDDAKVYTFESNQDQPILITDIDDKYDTVRFVYYIDATIDENKTTKKWGVKDNTGIKYTESYYFSKLEMTTNITGYEEITYKYFNLGLSRELSSDKNENLGYNTNLSNIEVTKKQILDDSFYNVHIFKDESMNTLDDTLKDINANIDRGIAASFEKHNALGEICTLSDMENYRNDYFNIGK